MLWKMRLLVFPSDERMMRLLWDCVEGLLDRIYASEGILVPCRMSLSALLLNMGERGESGAERYPSSSLKSRWLLKKCDLVPSLLPLI